MKVLKNTKELTIFLSKESEENVIAFVPTMGALHDGHISLIKNAKSSSDLVVCSIFVNPTQFNNSTDLEKYPRTIERDIEILEQENCDILYLPEVSDLYSENEKSKHFDFNGLDNFMEGSGRKGHFDGVATIVEKLFRIVNPDKAFFGEKDLQQLQIIRHITTQLNLEIEIIGVPTNLQKANLINETLHFIKENSSRYSPEELKQLSIHKFNNQSELKLEYLEIVSLENLHPITEFKERGNNAACIAASISGVRLIDNIIF